MWLEKAAAAGFVDLTVLSRQPMGEDRLPLYPIYQEGGLDALFALVSPEDRWRLVISATIRACKPGSSPEAERNPTEACRAPAEGGCGVLSKYDEFFGLVYGEGGAFDRKTKHLIALAASLAAGCEP